MKLFYKGKDGGPDSTVTGYWLIEWKPVFSIALLCFEDGSRNAYHNHAFNALSWLLRGTLIEQVAAPFQLHPVIYKRSLAPIWTPWRRMHRVTSVGRSWVLTFRGPWKDAWREYLPVENIHRTLTHGRIAL